MVFYRVGQDKKTVGNVWLGLHVGGIVVFDVHKGIRTPVHRCQWKRIENISFAVSPKLAVQTIALPAHMVTACTGVHYI